MKRTCLLLMVALIVPAALYLRDHGTTPVEAQARPASFVAHPRLLLTAAKKAELIARMKANTADYQSFKASADSLIANKPWMTVNSTLEAAIGAGDTSITVRTERDFQAARSRFGSTWS